MYVNEEQHLPYWQLPKTGSRTSPIYNQRGIYLYHMNKYAILKEYLQVLHKLYPKYFQVAPDKLSVLKFSLVEIETYFTIRLVLYTYIEVLSIQKKEDMTKPQIRNNPL